MSQQISRPPTSMQPRRPQTTRVVSECPQCGHRSHHHHRPHHEGWFGPILNWWDDWKADQRRKARKAGKRFAHDMGILFGVLAAAAVITLIIMGLVG